jgi:lysophospholipase L1-like esterase
VPQLTRFPPAPCYNCSDVREEWEVYAAQIDSDPRCFLSASVQRLRVRRGYIIRAAQAAGDTTSGLLTIGNGVDGFADSKAVIVVLNGKKVCKKSDLNKKTGEVSIPVELKAQNKIKIIVRGSGSAVKVTLTAAAGGGGGGFSRLIGYGDSLLAGFEDGSLVEVYQVWSLGAQIATHAGARFVLPLICEPGIPPRYKFENGKLILPDSQPGYRTNPNQQCHNLAVPGATLWATLNVKSLGGANPFYDIILGGQRTMIQEAKRLNPTFVLLWIGSNDVLGMVTSTDPEDHTSLNDFKRDFETVLQELKDSGAGIVAANLPDVTTVAILVKPLTIQVAIGGVPSNALILITDKILSKLNLGPDDYLTPDEVAQIRATVQAFNAEIAALCAKYGVPVVDIYSMSQRWESQGVYLAGRHLNAEWQGGLFSLDGIHPSNTGHAIIANEFINVINAGFGTSLPLVDVESVFWQDPNRPTSPPLREPLLTAGDCAPVESALRIINTARSAAAAGRQSKNR